MKKLPIGIQSFEKIRKDGYVYVDKTKHALDIINNYQYVFLSRPRRFGKSLFLDTLYHIFNGHKELFEDLYIYNSGYNFEPFPVIRISWGGDFSTQEKTEAIALDILYKNQERLGINCRNTDPGLCFGELIVKSYKKFGKRVVILIDEYDKPILDNIGNTEEAYKRRAFLRGMYVQMKENDNYIHFAFLTGITKFSKASIFSGLNNLLDISLHPDFATICGYTHRDLETVFARHLQGADMDKVQEWYNGYNFIGEHVYNPFDILQFIANNFTLYPYWWESGTPFSLIEFLKSGKYYIPELENLRISPTILNSFDIEKIRLESLLFQAGYLTIDHLETDEFTGQIMYKLRVPNQEVQISLNQLFYEYLTESSNVPDSQLIRSLYYGQIDALKERLNSIFASIPYENYVKNNISGYEGYYASVVYTYLAALGVKVIAEDVTNIGRIDLTMFIREKVYILEFKVGMDKPALEQIKERRYWEKYKSKAGDIYLIGINFDQQSRNIARFEWEKI